MGDYEVDGESCWFVSKERMLDGLEANEFLDVGEHDGYLFGTTLESVRNVMAENKLCVLDVRPEVTDIRVMTKTPKILLQALKMLHNSTEFLPYVIYVAPPPQQAEAAVARVVSENGRASQNIELAVRTRESQSQHLDDDHLPLPLSIGLPRSPLGRGERAHQARVPEVLRPGVHAAGTRQRLHAGRDSRRARQAHV